MGKKLGFSWSAKRAFGVSGAKNRISRKIGIPLTKSGRQRKVGRAAGCFVATVSYGGYDSVEVRFLRCFRDQILSKNYFGRIFVKLYYKLGPHMAYLINRSEKLKRISRLFLNRVIKRIEKDTYLKLEHFK